MAHKQYLWIALILQIPYVIAQETKTTYTPAFYYALIALGILITLIILFFYLFIKRPRNKWDKKTKTKQAETKTAGQQTKLPLTQRQPLRRPPRRTPPRNTRR